MVSCVRGIAEAVVRLANVRVREGLVAIQGEIVAEARAHVFESWLRWLGGVVGVLDDDGLAPPIESTGCGSPGWVARSG